MPPTPHGRVLSRVRARLDSIGYPDPFNPKGLLRD